MSDLLDKNIRQQGSEAAIGLAPVLENLGGSGTPSTFTLDYARYTGEDADADFELIFGMTAEEFLDTVKKGDIIEVRNMSDLGQESLTAKVEGINTEHRESDGTTWVGVMAICYYVDFMAYNVPSMLIVRIQFTLSHGTVSPYISIIPTPIGIN